MGRPVRARGELTGALARPGRIRGVVGCVREGQRGRGGHRVGEN
jgi:hypothetical protein